MKNFRIAKGANIYDFFIVPAIRLHNNGFCKYLTIEWLKWYFGIAWE